jgi:hypothetical protein
LNGGFVLTRPTIVSIDFEGDELDDAIRTFSDNVGSTSWWPAVREGYCDASGSCIGEVTHRAHVTLPALSEVEASTGWVDSVSAPVSSFRTFFRKQLDAGLLPEPTTQTLYMVYLPPGVPIAVEEREGCAAGGFGGYHDSMSRNADGTGVRFAYAVLPRCSYQMTYLQRIASHELIEAATDPFRTNGGYFINDLLWALVEGGEVADMCVDLVAFNDSVVENGLTLQRSWSNAALKRGENPCVPVPPGEVYFNVAPSVSTIALAYGETTRIAVDAFSDGPLEDWSVRAIDFAEALGIDQASLRLSLDRKSVNNGSQLVLTITSIRPIPQAGVGATFVLVSQSGNRAHIWPGVVFGR